MKDYRPPFYLKNPHIQSILASLKLRGPLVRRKANALLKAAVPRIIDCGEGVRLLGLHSEHGKNENGRDLAILFHGWEGSADSLYLISAASHLYDLGFDVFRLNFRDHGPTHHLNRELFHACRIDEVVGAVKTIAEGFSRGRTFLGGFSLGGNFALRTALRAPDAGIEIERVAAVSPVLHPVRTMHAMENGGALYHRYFLKKWKRSLQKKHALFPEYDDLTDLSGFDNLRRMTDHFAPKHTGYPTGEAYLNGYAITGSVLEGLKIPAHIIAGADDPVIPAHDLKRLAPIDNLHIELTPCGGHCGFFDNWRLQSRAVARMGEIFTRNRPEEASCSTKY